MKKNLLLMTMITLVTVSACLNEDDTVTSGGAAADTVAPVPGGGLELTQLDYNYLRVVLASAEDDVSDTEELYYKIVVATSSDSIDTIEEAEAIEGAGILQDWSQQLERNHSSLAENTQYCYAGLVRDEAGNKSLYTPKCKTTGLSPRAMFVTDATFHGGSIGGIEDADNYCNSDDNYPGWGYFKAMLVDDSNRSAMPTRVDWVLYPFTVYYSIHTDEGSFTNDDAVFEFDLDGAILGSEQDFWTGLNSDWTNSTSNCVNWTTNHPVGASGRFGDAGAIDSNFINDGSATNCSDKSIPILCVQQPD